MNVSDFNEDQHADLVTVNIYNATVSIFLGDGNGTFRLFDSYFVGGNPSYLAMADFNNDNHIDILTTDPSSPSITLSFGYGNGSLSNANVVATSGYPSSVSVGYLNNDPYIDIALTYNSSVYIGVLLGFGDGTFGVRKQLYAILKALAGLVISDFNGDRLPDFAVILTLRTSLPFSWTTAHEFSFCCGIHRPI